MAGASCDRSLAAANGTPCGVLLVSSPAALGYPESIEQRAKCVVHPGFAGEVADCPRHALAEDRLQGTCTSSSTQEAPHCIVNEPAT
jgi:hypothetical protein